MKILEFIENHEDHENHVIIFENNENHKNIRIHCRIMKIMKI